MDKGVHSPRFNAKTEGSQKTVGSRAEAEEGKRGERSDYLQWKNCATKRTTVHQDELTCFYINARNITNKFEQLEAWVSDLKPDIVGITESWTGSHILDAELTLEGYDLFRQDRPVDRCGGGVLLYIRNSLHAVQCSLVSQFPEQVWCYFMDSKGCRFHVGVCYRSPTLNIYGSGNHDLLRDTINELGITRKHFVLMGDCNYRYLHWPPLLDDHSISAEATEFYHCLEDNFFTQHVEFCTREDAILDLVISDEPNVVSNMTDLGPFSSSDHNAVTWKTDKFLTSR